LYPGLYKNDKRVDLSMYILKSTKFIIFFHFCVAHYTKNFVLKYFMHVGYIIDYVQICFQFILKLKSMVFDF
jgi:hypothetical protein